MIHHPIILGSKVVLLLIIVIVLVILHGILPPEQFKDRRQNRYRCLHSVRHCDMDRIFHDAQQPEFEIIKKHGPDGRLQRRRRREGPPKRKTRFSNRN